MFKSNSITRGIIYGLILPVISLFVFLFLLKGNFLILNKPGVPYLAAIGLNMLIARFCSKKGMDKTTIGIVLVSFIFMLAVFIFKLQPIR
jgi:hypothetical protein